MGQEGAGGGVRADCRMLRRRIFLQFIRCCSRRCVCCSVPPLHALHSHTAARCLVCRGVQCVAAAMVGAAVHAAGADGSLHTLSLESGESINDAARPSKHGISAAAVSGTSVLCAGSSMVLWDSEAGERRAKFTGHATPARALAIAPLGAGAASAAAGERSIALWVLPPPGELQGGGHAKPPQ